MSARPRLHLPLRGRYVFAVLLLGVTTCNPTPSTNGTPPATKGSQVRPSALQAKLQHALKAKGPGYVPRTHHKRADGSPKYTNRLILETSPYLIQHAHNPVDWFPWGNEAFKEAKRLKRPVFLSVGYSTCHWCHVMEEETFEDEAIARYLNEHYVCIKVDREERPDVDATYMAFVQSLTGRGGWPMSVWLTPDREPFYGGTYFPPRAGARGLRQGFLELSQMQAQRFRESPGTVVQAAKGYAARLRADRSKSVTGTFPPRSLLADALTQAERRFDPINGGTRGAPKFPSSFPVRLLLRLAGSKPDDKAREMIVKTLSGMRAGGIYDQIGGGFHRYATDQRWQVPHFEKMLYDNALLAVDYLEASQLTDLELFQQTTREVLDYVLREMTAPEGGFYSATDADSPAPSGKAEEGLFFTWTPRELEKELGQADARWAERQFGVTARGNFEGRSVLHLVSATRLDDGSDSGRQLARVRTKLLKARARRPPPLRDDKVLVAWNALTISALARAASVFGEARYAKAAVRAARFVSKPFTDGKRLPHGYFGGAPQGDAFADDYATLAAASLDLFEFSADPHWLTLAERLMAALDRDFSDPARGGYFLAATNHEQPLMRNKPHYDGPVPSVNSTAALTWLRLHAFTGNAQHEQHAETTLRAFSTSLSQNPLGLDHMLLAVDWATGRPLELVVVLPPGQTEGALSPQARPLLTALHHAFAPNTSLVVGTEAQLSKLSAQVPWLGSKRLRGGEPTAYLCERGVCQLPTTDPAVLSRQVRALANR